MFRLCPKSTLLHAARLSVLAILGSAVLPALAHDGSHVTGSFMAGFAHPFSGLDHLLAMLAVGILAARHTGVASRVLPATFVAAMAAGAAWGSWFTMSASGVSLVETGVVASLLLLGGLLAGRAQLPLRPVAVLVALFAILHGYVHSHTQALQDNALIYAAGFLSATAMLHLMGWLLGRIAVSRDGQQALRWSGAGIAATGLVLLSGMA